MNPPGLATGARVGPYEVLALLGEGGTLLDNGVREFATRNTRDFEGFGFDRVFDPLRAAPR